MLVSLRTLFFYLLSKKIVRFGGVGCLSTSLYYGLFILFEGELGIRYEIASALGFLPAFVVNFVLHKSWTFSNHSYDLRTLAKQLPNFSLNKLLFFAANLGMLHVCVEWIGLAPWLAQIIAIAVLGGLSYVSLLYWVFAR